MLTEYVVDETKAPKGLRGQKTMLNIPGGPEALFSGLDPRPVRPEASGPIPPHLHLPPQFYLVIRGAANFPRHPVSAIGVHYTDPGVPYGPFTTTPDHSRHVVHASPGGFMWMSDPEARKNALPGREFFASVADSKWEPAPNGARKAVLFRDPRGAACEVLECPAGTKVSAGPSKYGRYEIVCKGSVILGGKTLPVNSLRFVKGDEAPAPLTAGPGGATVALCHFDDAAEGTFAGGFVEDEVTGRVERPAAD